MTDAIEVLYYQTAGRRVPYREWLDTVSDPVGEGVWELRIDTGAGYRVYYARSGKQVVLLLCGGDKRKQKADIKTAKAYWRDYEQRTRSRGRSR